MGSRQCGEEKRLFNKRKGCRRRLRSGQACDAVDDRCAREPAACGMEKPTEVMRDLETTALTSRIERSGAFFMPVRRETARAGCSMSELSRDGGSSMRRRDRKSINEYAQARVCVSAVSRHNGAHAVAAICWRRLSSTSTLRGPSGYGRSIQLANGNAGAAVSFEERHERADRAGRLQRLILSVRW